MEYDVVIRYEPQLAGQWEDVRLRVERPDGADIDGPCANLDTSEEEIYQVSLPSGGRHAVVYPSVCLEANKNYNFRLEFNAYDRLQETPSASVLIDSITVVPRADSVPFLAGSQTADQRRQEFEHYRCAQYFYSVVKASIPDVCRKHLYSIGFYVLGSGYECQCDPTGSYSGICDSLGNITSIKSLFISLSSYLYFFQLCRRPVPVQTQRSGPSLRAVRTRNVRLRSGRVQPLRVQPGRFAG